MENAKSGVVLVSGATGLVGRRLTPRLADRFETIRTLSRSARSTWAGMESIQWDGVDPGAEALVDVEAVIHLAGEPIFGGLPSAKRMQRIRASRIDSTRKLVERIAAVADDGARPTTLVCASAVGIYGDRGEESLSEESPPGEGFLADLCRDWEAEARKAEALGVRVVNLRIGVVLSREGGALGLMRLPFSLGVGGRLGDGKQFFPWIHLDDLVDVILWALDTEVVGPVNAVAPEAVRNEDLTRALAATLHRPAILPVPAFALKAALGTLSGELLGSRLVKPSRLVEAGFEFQYPTLASALEAELG